MADQDAGRSYPGFSAEERAAMKEYARELKATTGRGSRPDPEAVEQEVLARIQEMGEPDRGMALRIHALVARVAPQLVPRLWYGMPAYAKDGKVLCFFQPAQKFQTRYATFGFSDVARLDEDGMWPCAYALTRLSAEDEARIGDLLRRAIG